MKRYHITLTIIILLAAQAVQAQVTLSLALNSRPQAWLADWANPVNGQMIISYMPGPALNDPAIKLRTTLLDESGNALGTSNINAARVYTLSMGVNQFSMADALQLKNLSLPGNIRNLLQRTGRLAAGQYQLMVDVMNSRGERVLARQTRPFFITSYQLPVLMQPANDAELNARIAQSVIIFRWTSVIPSTAEMPTYRVQVFEILPGQTPMQAFRGNRPLLDEAAIRGTTQYIWRPNLPMLDSTANSRFIWTVQTLDREGQPVPTMDNSVQARSEPAIFHIINPGTVINKKEQLTIKN